MDRLTKFERSALMAKIGTKNTDIEKLLNDIVKPFWKDERYRKNVKTLIGKPDILFSKSRIVVFADGDFWHGKNFMKWAGRVPKFWRNKISANIERDRLQTRILKKAGYRVFRFYGSKIKNNPEEIGKILQKALK